MRPLRIGTVGSRPFVPVDSQPLEPVENRLQCFGNVPFRIGIVDPQNELPTGLSSQQPIKKRGANAANVEIAGWTGSKSGTNCHGTTLKFKNLADRLTAAKQTVYGIRGSSGRFAMWRIVSERGGA